MALFKLTNEELREAFVRARFAEEQHFGMSDIEDWLQMQRGVRTPDRACWDDYATREDMFAAPEGAELDVLRLFGDALPSVPLDPEERGELLLRQRLQLFLDILSKADPDVQLYYGKISGVILAHTQGGQITSAVSIDAHRGVAEVTSADVIDVIYGTWVRGGSKALKARDFFCNALAEMIKEARKLAEDDFDRAVAVTEDGSKILHADKVIVYDDNLTVDVYPPEAFQTQKILRQNRMERREVGMRYFDKDPILLAVNPSKKRHEQEHLICLAPSAVKRDPDKRIFITHRRFCPEPLPEPAQ